MHNQTTTHQRPRDRQGSIGQDSIQTKRLRTGSISGRLRAASDLEELGLIDKSQKGIIKDTIISSSDTHLLELLDKYKITADASEVVPYINGQLTTRADSIDILEGLDFDFLTQMATIQQDDNSEDNQWMEHSMRPGNTSMLGHDIGSSSASGRVRKDSSLSMLDDMGERNRKGSIDALMNGALLDDFATPYEGELEFDGVFHDFPHGDVSPNSPRGDKLRKVIRMTHPDGSVEMSTDKVDLSAYATHAAHLQQQNLEKKFNMVGHPQTDALRIKLESNGKMPVVLGKPGVVLKSPYIQSNIVSPYMTTQSSGMEYPSSAMMGGSDMYYGGMDHNLSASASTLISEMNQQQQQPSSQSSGSRLAGYIGAYSPEQRKLRIEKFLEKRSRRVWTRKVKYDVRKNFADSRLRIKGRFVKKEDEDIMRELMSI